MVLVNGADGIGTGWSTDVPQYNPKEIAQNIIKKIDGKEIPEMLPWYRNYHGTITNSRDKNGIMP